MCPQPARMYDYRSNDMVPEELTVLKTIRYPAAKIRSYEWSKKVKHIARRFKNGFREGGAAPPKKKAVARE
ncbi:putative 60S ribosomal protein L37-A [Symbiodinium microadriaticum]|uniref:Putative 60S ribosomal protein L37-A n=1 Tax=Symbiodinium microadriaticum TaxID=2951 RepID=A0A1Q9D9Z7_SYMMI|nr:putative 60S ribosomal protein L37-A [Symbiodinium microadriaticum]